MPFTDRPTNPAASARAVLADVHARAGNLARAKRRPELATAPEDEPRLVEHLRQALRRIATRTGRVYATATVEVTEATYELPIPGLFAGAKVTRAAWTTAGDGRFSRTPEASGETVELAVSHFRHEAQGTVECGTPGALWVTPTQLVLRPGTCHAGTLTLHGPVRSGFELDGTGVATAEPLGNAFGGIPKGRDAVAVSFPREFVSCAAHLVLREFYDERGEEAQAAKHAERAEEEMKTFVVDDRQTGFAAAVPRPFG